LVVGSGATSYAGLIAALTPAGYWKLPETGTDDWADSSGQGRTLDYVSVAGTVRGVAGIVEEDDGVLGVTVDGGAGSSAHANTTVGERRGDSGLRFANVAPFTVVAWINPDDLPASIWSDGICGNVDNDAASGDATKGYGLYIDATTGFPLFRRRDDSGTQIDAIGTSPVPTGSWTMLAGVFTGSNVEIYVDGELVDTAAASGNMSGTAGDCFFIGACGIAEGVGGTWAPFRGSIDSVAVIAADVGDQISALFNAGPIVNEPSGYVWTADGAGGTSWEPVPSPPPRFFADLQGPLPASPETSGSYRVPFRDGAGVTYNLSRAEFHLETDGSTTTTVVIEKSSTPGSFTPATVATLSLTSGQNDVSASSSLGTISSGDLLRFNFTAIGTGADDFYVQLEGTAA
jgi:hypothetical protein